MNDSGASPITPEAYHVLCRQRNKLLLAAEHLVAMLKQSDQPNIKDFAASIDNLHAVIAEIRGKA